MSRDQSYDPGTVEALCREGTGRKTVAEHRHPLHQRSDLLEAVADIDDADPVGRQLAHEVEQPLRFGMAERGRRLVEDQDLGLAAERLGDLDQLPVAGSELGTKVVGNVCADHVEQPPRLACVARRSMTPDWPSFRCPRKIFSATVRSGTRAKS